LGHHRFVVNKRFQLLPIAEISRYIMLTATLEAFVAIGYPGYFVFDAVWPSFYYSQSLTASSS